MITGITIENFKGIRDRVELDFRPITLLFGANSAGKSTVLHALHYACEVFCRRNLNPDQTVYGGSSVDLGGFLNLVHGHDRTRQIRISLIMNASLADFENLTFRGITESDTSMDSFCREFERVEVAFVVGWTTTLDAPTILRYEISIDGEFVAAVFGAPGRPETMLQVNSRHPAFLSVDEYRRTRESVGWLSVLPEELDIDDWDPDETLLAVVWNSLATTDLIEGANHPDDEGSFGVYLDQRHGAMPNPDRVLPLRTATRSGVSETADDYDRNDPDHVAVECLMTLMTRLIAGPAALAGASLETFRYLGPVRDTPPRIYSPPRFPDAARWASGLAAWDALHNGSDRLIDAVSEWLVDPDNLNAGCRVERRTFLELDMAHPVVRKLIDGRAFDDVEEDEAIDLTKMPRISRIVVVPSGSDIELRPHDVGVGISQVVPVVVMALDGDGRLLAIEQPELHLHPRLQAEIADLFVEAIAKNNHQFIIETHSEHLILRLLRRIRETEVGKAPPNRQLRTDDLAIYYLKQEHGTSTETRIDVDVKGEFIQPWPDDFFEIDFYERFTTGENA